MAKLLPEKKYTEAIAQMYSVKNVLFENSQNSQENTFVRVSFLHKVASLRPATLLKKETLAQVFSCEFCKISKNTFLKGTPLVAASEVYNL